MHTVDVFQHPLANAVHILNPGKKIERLAWRHQLIEHACFRSDFVFPCLTLLVRFHDGPNDLLDPFVEQIHLGDASAHDRSVIFAESVGVRFEVLVNTSHKNHIRFAFTYGFHKPLQDIL